MAQSAEAAAKPEAPPTPPEQPELLKQVAGNQAGMFLVTPGALDDADAHLAHIRELGLESHILELEVRGYTVVPPEMVAPPEFTARVRDALLRLAEEKTGVKHSIDRNGDTGKYAAFAAGGDVATTFDDLYYLERACLHQVLAQSTGLPLKIVPKDICELTARQIAGEKQQAYLHFESLKRMLERDDPDFMT